VKLAELLAGLCDEPVNLDRDFEIKGIALDSRKVERGFVFIAVAGATQHGLIYVKQAVENGAKAIIYDPQGSEGLIVGHLDSYQLAVSDLGLKLGRIADRFYQSPSRALNVIGITGTNGKTTCSQFLSQLLPECGVIGTLGWGGESDLKQTLNTTPDALAVQEMLKTFVSLKKQTVVMEVSSHGLHQGRVNDVCFKGAVFTSLSRDHLDYHGSMEAYLKAKLSLFEQPDLQFVVVNTDDPNSERFLEVTDNNVKRWAFSATGNKSKLAANVIAEQVNFSLNGIKFLVCNNNEKALVGTNIVGNFNLDNILAVITVLLAQGYPLQVAANKVSKLVPVTGRMEFFGGHGHPFVFVDYAHTPDALEKVLKGLKKTCQQKLWLVFGCGGNRDKGKRAQMGEIAEMNADQVIITNDNPRFESPEQIISDIVAGCSNKEIEVIQNREQAIQSVIMRAEKGDCILVAGKGHEEYQDIEGVKHAFSDQGIVKQTLLELG
jgi:UDP-N-acetylmuramoyl-L-alanyl-D-glutamate--2,6-diaminopimelate ligase